MRGIDVGDRDRQQRLAIGRHRVAVLPACFSRHLSPWLSSNRSRHCLNVCGVQLGGTSGHALGVALGHRIDPARQQLAGFIGLGAGLGEADDARAAETHTRSRLSIW